MQLIANETIENESVAIDGKHFVDCVLVDCILEYCGQEVIFERTILRGCKHVFYGPARGTLHYLQNVGLMPFNPREWGEFSDVVQ